MSAAPQRCVAVPPGGGHYLLVDAHVPTGCVQGALPPGLEIDVDNLARLDIEARFFVFFNLCGSWFVAGLAARRAWASGRHRKEADSTPPCRPSRTAWPQPHTRASCQPSCCPAAPYCTHHAHSAPPGLPLLTVQVRGGKVAALYPAGAGAAATSCPAVDLRGKMVLPTFADLHTHIGARAHCTAAAGQPSRVVGGGMACTRLAQGRWTAGQLAS